MENEEYSMHPRIMSEFGGNRSYGTYGCSQKTHGYNQP